MRAMPMPDSLADRIEDFRERVMLPDYADGLFQPVSWISVLLGQNVVPRRWDPRANAMDADELSKRLAAIHSKIADDAAAMPLHLDFLERSGARYIDEAGQ